MENSFFEYRDKTGADSGSDGEIIDDSMILESVPYSVKKKNRTVFVAESDESITNGDDTKESQNSPTAGNVSKSISRNSNAAGAHAIYSSEDEDYSPELVPKRRPPPRQNSIDPNKSLILQRTMKRMIFQDSDTDNSIIIENRKNNKVKCLKDTPLKIEVKSNLQDVDKSIDSDESCDNDENDNDDEEDESDEYDANEPHASTHIKKTPLKIEIKSDVQGADKSIDYDESCDSDHDNEEDVSDKYTDIKKKCKNLVINSDESSNDDENDNNLDMSEQQINTDMKKKYKKLVINSDESSDDDNNVNEQKTNTNMKKKTKLVFDSDESSDNDNNGDTKIISDQCEIISKAVKKTDILSTSQRSDHDYYSNNEISNENDSEIDDDDDGPDEDMMVMSRATRMSIMGMIPKDNDSDDSDFIQSDSSSLKASESRADSIEELQNFISEPNTPLTVEKSSDDNLPEVTIQSLEEVKANPAHDDQISIQSNNSRISCSPFSSPLQDITNKSLGRTNVKRKSKALNSSKVTDYMDLTVMPDMEPKVKAGVIDLNNVESNFASNKVLDRSVSVLTKKIHNDDDVTIIDSKPEIIALSSDDEDEPVKTENSSVAKAKSPKNAADIPQRSMKQYLAPSRAGQVVYVKKHVKQNELNKLAKLKEDVKSVRTLLEEMDLDTLPDGGSRLISRCNALEAELRVQGDKVANMVVETDEPSEADLAAAADEGLSWEDIQKRCNAVQPRMFGKQAMATHMAERNLTLDRLRHLHASLGSRPDESTLAAAPRLLRSTLMPYQRHALAWLQWRETQKPAAGILADDMGLGKTITMISLIASDKQDNLEHGDDADEAARDKLVRGGTLVVCPASLIQQWASEVGKHCAPHALSVCLHHGAARAAHPHRLAAHDMVVTTYNILQRDSDKNGVLMRVQWRRIILDEAHIVRNYKSATSVAVSRLPAARRWCLTGTPVQNKDLDLFALLKFLRLSPFDDLPMWKKWIDNKSEGGQERLNTIMQCILLRRTKAVLQEKGQLACLPPRTAHTRLVTLSSDEMNVYQKVLVLSKTLFAQFLHQRAEKNSGGTFTAPGKDSEYAKMHKRMIALQGVKPVKSHEILVLLLRLRQVCCHCGLIGSILEEGAPGADPEQAGADLLRELDKLSLEESRRKSQQPEEEEPEGAESAKADEAIRSVVAPNHPVFQLSRPSSKIAAVMDCLKDNVFTNKGHKAVVVSQWTSVLGLVEQELNKEKIRSVTLSGAVPVPARPRLIQLVNDPNSDVRVMLLSLCAGGVGINLCGANHLLLLDPHWNPQLEEQAQDRIYRVGQTKPVNIYRFVCVDTVEQTIRKLQEAKLQLADNVLTGAGASAGSPLSVEELKMMFNMV